MAWSYQLWRSHSANITSLSAKCSELLFIHTLVTTYRKFHVENNKEQCVWIYIFWAIKCQNLSQPVKKWIKSLNCYISPVCAPCGLRGCKNGPAPFPGRMSYKATKLGLVCLSYLSMVYYCIVVYWGPFLCIVSFRCCVFCLLVVLAKLSVLAKWLARKTPLTKPNRGERIISIKPRPKSLWLCWFIVFFHCSTALCSPRPYVIHFLVLWHDNSLFVLKVS